MEVSELSELLGARDVKAEQCFDVPEDPLSIVTLTGDAALGMPTVEMLPPLTVLEEQQDEDTVQSNDSSEDVIVQLMDIRTRLSTLRTMLERRLGASLTNYTFWLQDAKELESHKTLVDQCIKGEGVVQVNLQVQPQGRRINILDVLKPDEELVDLAPGTIGEDETAEKEEDAPVVSMEIEEIPPTELLVPSTEATQKPLHSTMVRWIVDQQFQSERLRLKIPEEPAEWSVAHVRLWIQWAVRQFNLTGIKLPDWSISGEELSAMTLHEFREKCPSDPGDIFWTHFELLRKCKFIAVVQNEDPGLKEPERQYSVKKRKPQPLQSMINCEDAEYGPTATRGGSNGQIHLWQFLLELLTTAAHLPVIQWHGTEGEFKLCDPERVARLWGTRKHKPAMNYEKLSRALRYYYDGDMIAKVSGKRFVYKFVCDLRMLVGYDAGELARLVRETRAQEFGEGPADA